MNWKSFATQASSISALFTIMPFLGQTAFTTSLWNICADADPLTVLWNVCLKQCLLECQLRQRCTALNFLRLYAKCELLSIANGFGNYFPANKCPCVHIRMSDVPQNHIQHQFQLPSVCDGCTQRQTCDVTAFSCTIQECDPLTVNNAIVVGNRLAVGSKVQALCEPWYYAPYVDTSVCQSDGSWSPQPHCEPLYDCGLPPYRQNALSEPYNITTILYTCYQSYATEAGERILSLECLNTGNWASYFTYDCVLWGCQIGWHRIGNSCYWVDVLVADFTTTEALCMAKDAYVLQLETQEENDVVKYFLYQTYGFRSWWLGLTDKHAGGDWRWMAENTTAPFLTWNAGEPENRACEDHVVLNGTDAWFDDCKQQLHTQVCEKGIQMV